jgi:hypothetical protein
MGSIFGAEPPKLAPLDDRGNGSTARRQHFKSILAASGRRLQREMLIPWPARPVAIDVRVSRGDARFHLLGAGAHGALLHF